MANIEEFRESLTLKEQTALKMHETKAEVRREALGIDHQGTTSDYLTFDVGYFLGLAHGLERAREMSKDVDE